MIRVAVVEDEKEAADLLESQLARYEKESGGGFAVFGYKIR